jgi:hypothetical protein
MRRLEDMRASKDAFRLLPFGLNLQVATEGVRAAGKSVPERRITFAS